VKILVTGAAGFIGMHVAEALLSRGDQVIAVDNLSQYYDVQLKEARLARLRRHGGFRVDRIDIADRRAMANLFDVEHFDRVVHLAAQAGVRHSLADPLAYIDANLCGFANIMEGCRHNDVGHLVYASSSSIYGSNARMPFAEGDNADHPLSLYAATKKANELMAHSYSHLFALPTTGLRFFTVYGPWGRPDMALSLFTAAIREGRPIDVFNRGQMIRDFTYIDDITRAVVKVLDKAATPNDSFNPSMPDPASSNAPYRIFNIGNNRPIPLTDYIAAIENALGIKAIRNMLPLQPGDAAATSADVDTLERWIGFRPDTHIDVGVSAFVKWHQSYYPSHKAKAPQSGARQAAVAPVML